MNIYFTKEELEILASEFYMLKESCVLCQEENIPRADEGVIYAIYDKVREAQTKSNSKPQKKRISKWDRFRE